MKKSPEICARDTGKKKGNLHCSAQDNRYIRCTWPSTDRSKSNVGEPSKRGLSNQSSGRDGRTRSCHKIRTEGQSRQNETNSEQTRCFVKSVSKQEGGKRTVEGNEESGGKGASNQVAESSPRGLHWSGSTVRRYALYRSMLSTSSRVESTKSGNERGFPCVAQSRTSSGMAGKAASLEQSVGFSQSRERPPQKVLPVILDEVGPLDFTRGFDLKGTQFPKRIYIREYVNDAIVDELVDVRNQEDWDLLTYMAPLRPITVDTTDRPRDLRFQDLRDFDVYYYPFDWRRLVDN